MNSVEAIESRVAVYTNWALFGSFGFGFTVSGFSDGNFVLGFIGFVLFLIGFCAHLIIQRIFGTNFSKGEVALALTIFSISVLAFVGSWLFDPRFDKMGSLIGLTGFGSIVIGLIVYLVTKFGLKESYSMIRRTRQH